MSRHKGGSGTTPFGGFVYEDQSGQVTSGTVQVTCGDGTIASAPFTVDQSTRQASVAGSDFSPPDPMNVTEVEFSTDPMFPANTTDPGAGEDPVDPSSGHFAMHAQGWTKPVGTSTELMNCCDIDLQTP